jgi:hypothetical protein
VFRQPYRPGEIIEHFVGHRVADFHPDGKAEALLKMKFFFERVENIARFVLADFEIGVARHAKQTRLAGFHIRKKIADVCRDQLAQKGKARFAFVDRNQPRHVRRQLDARKTAVCKQMTEFVVRKIVFRLDDQPEIQAEIGDKRKLVTHVDRLRRQHGKDFFMKIIVEPFFFSLIQILITVDFDALRSKRGQNFIVQTAHLFGKHRAQALADLPHLFGWRKPVAREFTDVFGDLFLQARNANHKKFVEIGRKYRQKFQPFEQRIRFVECFVEHAAIKFEPAQLAVEKRIYLGLRFGKVFGFPLFGG